MASPVFVSNARYVRGAGDIDARLARLPAAIIDQVAAALEAGAGQIAATAAAIAPVSTEFDRPGEPPGQLRRSIHVERGRHALSFAVVADARDKDGRAWPAFVEYGHKLGGFHVAARPFAWPAYRVKKRAVKSKVTRAMRQGIANAGITGAP